MRRAREAGSRHAQAALPVRKRDIYDMTQARPRAQFRLQARRCSLGGKPLGQYGGKPLGQYGGKPLGQYGGKPLGQ
jgi:hypothetical protein